MSTEKDQLSEVAWFFEASLPTNVSLPISEQHTGKQDCKVNEKYIQSIIK